jgi:hypothetical protein
MERLTIQVDNPEEEKLIREFKAEAKREGKTIKELLIELLQKEK